MGRRGLARSVLAARCAAFLRLRLGVVPPSRSAGSAPGRLPVSPVAPGLPGAGAGLGVVEGSGAVCDGLFGLLARFT